ncbi:RagB/SusD family nutrient uptake outer membrane protein [Algivirga pacifica]|uniref:SusD/RagB family nutrient-binding outer membrane lipoprotein n=1 Tax=Algivirga pacifica TaxID=1162670 RepID=A0ABP9D495_9BACT
MKKYIFAAVAALGMTTACTDNFEDINKAPHQISEESFQADYLFLKAFFPQMQQSIYYNFGNGYGYQLQQNLNADIYSGYMTPPTPFIGNKNNATYALVDGWNSWAFNKSLDNILAPAKSVSKHMDLAPEFYGVSLILKVAGMHRVTDMYGPIPYTKYGEVNEGGGLPYDSQEAVYDMFFEELDMAISLLKDKPAIANFSEVDQMFKGDFNMWAKFAASLKLRLAMRISEVAPAKAKTLAEAAISAGVLEGGDLAQVSADGLKHPMALIKSWKDALMGAPMESILKGFNDPRLAIYFDPSDQDGEYRGIRQGIEIETKDTYSDFSGINDNVIGVNKPLLLMTAAEVYFLRAEAALNGWSAGASAKELYEMGVQASFDQHGAGDASTYLADATSMPADYVDPENAANDIAAQSDITIAWDAAASAMVNKERILTQKWIAMFPEGQEAWSEYRRTGYPKLFPVEVNYSNGTIDSEEGIKRIPYPSAQYQTNAAAVEAAVQMLGGADHGGTNLWWDVD